jgi:hypothetical protein
VEVTPANPSPIPDEPEEMVVLDLCSLLTEEEVAKVLTVEVTASDEMGFANCSYTSADPTLPYSVSVSSAQGIEAKELNLVGVQLLLAFAADADALEPINQLVENAEDLSVWEIVCRGFVGVGNRGWGDQFPGGDGSNHLPRDRIGGTGKVDLESNGRLWNIDVGRWGDLSFVQYDGHGRNKCARVRHHPGSNGARALAAGVHGFHKR